ncbi:P-loop containing nucleoside triphosphate hydrolase protein [Lanmaoa asiatica]|nr:P-loop containing nucleoside triphosphate hydrolase protein [Lanmaoa asiatica]
MGTRNRGRNSRTPATTTTTSTSVSPLSNTNSVEPETPDTSEPELEKTVIPTPVVTRNARKRVAEDEVDINVASKRRVVADGVVVKPLPVRALKTKARILDFICNILESTPAPKNKGKGKARVIDTPEPDDDESPSEDDEVYEESDESGSDYEVVPDSEEETLMVNVAIEASHRTARRENQQRLGAGPSTSRAPAAGRGMTHAVESDEELDQDSAESDDEPVSRRKGKAKAKSKKGKAKISTEPLSWVERVERRRRARLERNATKREERLLSEKLGRKLTWAEKTSLALQKHHPELTDVWGDLEEQVPVIIPEKAEQPTGLKVTLLPFQQESLWWMRKQENSIWYGGMLALRLIFVSRSMGKTIQMISLFVSDLKRPNLVIAPTVAIMQWRNEINAHTEGMNVLVWHGASRIVNPQELEQYDVVLTSFAVVESCFRKQESGFKRKGHIVKEASPLHQIKWNRIVLDEAHNIKERSTNTAKACFELDSSYKWCLSGTPLQNRVGELYSMIRFLGGDPFAFYFCKKCECKSLHWKFSDKRNCDGVHPMPAPRLMSRLIPYSVECGHSPMQHTCFWNNEILTPIQKNGMVGPGKTAFKKLRALLDRMMLRRTKIQRADDLGLPPRMVVVRRDYFSPEEKELYLSLFSDATRQFSTYVDSGTVLNSELATSSYCSATSHLRPDYSNIFSLLTRMRQMACHPDLVLRSKSNGNTFFSSEELSEATVCRLCNDIAEDAIQAKCHHIFDRECMKQYLSTAGDINVCISLICPQPVSIISGPSQPECPVCHLPLTIDLEGPALELESTLPAARQGIIGRLNLDTWRSSSKIEALVEELSNLRAQDATTKSIVFSQFVNFLDLIAFRLQKAGFQICRLEGTMSPQARDATIQHFMTNVHVTVFLVSLKAGGVALNLTEASRVYLMDSWWNPAVEYQAMDRIHRLGQHRPVQAIKLVIEDSIESRIIQLQEKKSAMVNATLSTDESAMGRLTPEDLGFLFRL